MPIDPSIPLQVKQFHVPTAQEMMSLQDLATRNQLNQTNLQEKQLELGQRNQLLEIMKQPGATDPNTGMLTPIGLGQITQVNPKMGMELGHQQQTITLQNMQFDEKKMAIKREVLGAYVGGYQEEVQRGANPQDAAKTALQKALSAVDEGVSSGHYAAQGFNKDAADKLRQQLSGMPPETARTMITAMGGKAPDIQAASPMAKLEADRRLGRISEADYQAQKAKLNAPTQTTLMMSGQFDLPPETSKFLAQQVLAGDNTAAQGFARNARARAQIAQAVVDEAKAQGMSAKDAANAVAEFQGQKAGQRTLGTRQAQIELAANVTKQFAPLAVAASENFDRTGIKSLNDVEKFALSRTASPELRKFNFANLSLINAYARAINPTGVGKSSDKEHAREVLDTGFTKGDYKAAVDQLQLEINAELKAPGEVKQGMREFFTGKKGEASKGGFEDAEKERRYQEWKAKQGG